MGEHEFPDREDGVSMAERAFGPFTGSANTDREPSRDQLNATNASTDQMVPNTHGDARREAEREAGNVEESAAHMNQTSARTPDATASSGCCNGSTPHIFRGLSKEALHAVVPEGNSFARPRAKSTKGKDLDSVARKARKGCAKELAAI